MPEKQKKKTYVFIDATNIIYSAKRIGKSTARELKQLLGGNVTDIDSIKGIISFGSTNKIGTDALEESVPRGYGNKLPHKKKKVKR